MRAVDEMRAPFIRPMTRHRVAVIPGDGIGREVIPQGMAAIDAALAVTGDSCEWTQFDWSCERFGRTGEMMPRDGLLQLRDHEAIYLGAIGWPTVPDHVSLWQLLFPIRREFDQYANVRPCRVMPGLSSPLADVEGRRIDFWVVRENTEGEYSSIGGRLFAGTDREVVIQETVFTRIGVDRILRFAFDLAKRTGRRHVTSATKSNGLAITMPFWDERFAAISAEYPEVRSDQFHIDILTAHFVRQPERFDVVVASNLFGDILSDLGPAVCGSIGIAPSANINPERRFPSMFEPVHGSAPDIAGRGVANPIGAIWSGALMLAHLGATDAHDLIMRSIEDVVASGQWATPDIGGNASTEELGAAVVAWIMAR